MYSYDLQKRTHRTIADKVSLRFPSPYVEGWVTSLVDVTADASQLYLTVGMMRPNTSAGFRMVNHLLARMDLATGNISFRFAFEGVFLLGSSSCFVAKRVRKVSVNALTGKLTLGLRLRDLRVPRARKEETLSSARLLD
jgi:hypothetical protein